VGGAPAHPVRCGCLPGFRCRRAHLSGLALLLDAYCPPLLSSSIFSWELMEAAAGAPQLTGSVLPAGMTGPAMVRALLDEAAGAGLTVVRAW